MIGNTLLSDVSVDSDHSSVSEAQSDGDVTMSQRSSADVISALMLLNKFCTTYQHGLRKRLSCKKQLGTFEHDSLLNLDNAIEIKQVFLDFLKTLNRVSPKKVVLIVSKLNPGGNLVYCITCLLTRRMSLSKQPIVFFLY